MRLTSFSLWLALTATLTAATGCGNNKTTTEEKQPPLDLPPIVQGPANSVSYAEGEILSGFAFANDTDHNRIIIADTTRGIMAVDNDTKAVSVLVPLGQQNTGDTIFLQKITDIALDETQRVLYILDNAAKKIFAADLLTNSLSVIAEADDFTIGERFAWSVPVKIIFDNTHQRLLIGDASGLLNATNSTTSTFNAFALFAYSLDTQMISVVEETANLASPLLYQGIRSFYLDEANNRLFTSGVYFPEKISSSAVQHITALDLSDWSKKTLYLSATTTSANSPQHAISYDASTDTLYFIESNFGHFISMDISDANPDLAFTILVNNITSETYPLQSPNYLTQVNGELWIYDRSAKTLFNVDKTTGERSIIFNGAPITPSPFDRPLFPIAMGIDPDEQTLLIFDAVYKQRQALTLTDSNFGKFTVPVDLTGIIAVTRSLTAPAEGETIAPATITEPKIVLSKITPSGALITFNELFERETDDELVRNVYYSTFLKRAAGASKSVPINTYVSDNETRIFDLANYFSNVSSSTLANQMTDFAASDSEILMIVGGNQLRLFNYVTTNNDEKIKYVGSLGPYTPAQVTGAAFNPNNGEFLLIDAQHDALLGLSFDGNKVATIRSISGRETASDNFLALPSGLAFNASTNTAYTFENQTRSVIAINVTTGARTRLDSAVNYIQSGGKITLSADNTKLYIVDANARRIVEFDLISHDQRWIDKF